MLSLKEFSAGHLADVKDMSLLIPRDQYGNSFLLAPQKKGLTAIFLDGPHRFWSFDATGNTSYSGLIIPAVYLQVDETSVFNPDAQQFPLGSLIRHGEHVSIFSKIEGGGFHENRRIIFDTGLPSLSDSVSIGFHKWVIAVGQGNDRRQLCTIDVSPAPLI